MYQSKKSILSYFLLEDKNKSRFDVKFSLLTQLVDHQRYFICRAFNPIYKYQCDFKNTSFVS